MTNCELLKKKINDCGVRKGYICSVLDISYGSLKKKLDGIVEFKLSEVDLLCEILHIKSLREKNDIFF